MENINLLEMFICLTYRDFCDKIKEYIIAEIQTKYAVSPKVSIRWDDDFGLLPSWLYGRIRIRKNGIVNVYLMDSDHCHCRYAYIQDPLFVVNLIDSLQKYLNELSVMVQKTPLLQRRTNFKRIVRLCRKNHYEESAALNNIVFPSNEYQILMPFAEGFEVDELPECELVQNGKMLSIKSIEESYPIEYLFVKSIKEIV